MANFTIQSLLWSAFVIGFFAFITYTVLKRVFHLVIEDGEKKKQATKGMEAMLWVVAVICFFAVASLRLPAFEKAATDVYQQVAGGVSHASTSVKLQSPFSGGGTTTSPPTSTTPGKEIGREKAKNVFSLPDNMGSGNNITHEVKKGDTVFSLAKKYGTTPEEIARINGINPEKIKIGDKLKIPKK